MPTPEFQAVLHYIGLSCAIRGEASGDDPSACEAVVEHDKAVIKADVEDGEFEVVDGVLFQAGFDELFQVVAPIAEAAAEREREIGLVEQFVTGDE